MTGRGTVRWLFFAGAMIGCAGLFLVVPMPYSALIFLALLGGVIVYGLVFAGQDTTGHVKGEIVAVLSWQNGRALALAACGLMIVGAWMFRPDVRANMAMGFWIAVLGMLLLGAASKFGRSRTDTHQPKFALLSLRTVNSPIRWLIVAAGLVALILLTAINVTDCEIGERCAWDVSQHVQFWLLWGGILLLVWGLADQKWSRSSQKTGTAQGFSAQGCKTSARHALVLTGIVLLALIVRLWNLEYSIHRFVDEIHYVHAIASLRDYPAVRILIPFNTVTAFTWLFPYFDWLSVSLLGPSLTSIRLASALTGTLNVLALYFLVRTLFDRKTALLAALFLATFPPHIHFSRLALNNIVDPLLGTLVLLFLARGQKTGRRIDWTLAGICLGLTQYFYEGGRLLFPPLAVIWLGWMILTRRHNPDTSRRPPVQWRRMALFVVVALVIAAPFYVTLVARDWSLTPRMDDTTNHNWQQALIDDPGRLFSPFLLFIHQPDTFWFYGGETGLILPYLVPLFLLGIAHAVWRIREPGMALLLGWIMAAVFGNNLMENTTDASRYVVVYPALAALLALGLIETARLLFPPQSRSPQPVGSNPLRRIGRVMLSGRVMGIAVLILTLIQVNYYFGPHLKRLHEQFRPAHDVDDAIFRAISLPRHTTIYIITNSLIFDYNPNGILRLWERDKDMPLVITSPDDLAQKIDTLDPGNYAFFIEALDIPAQRLMLEHYPDIQPLFSPYDVPMTRQFLLYFVPR